MRGVCSSSLRYGYNWFADCSSQLPPPPPPSPIGGGWLIDDDSFGSTPPQVGTSGRLHVPQRQLQIKNFGLPDLPATPGSSLRGRRAQCVADE